ncbi:MAG: hypothetical protein COB02_02820 [Candidatus Cloacimonadota bacterium]|nr:MAG: hypothetical protein COB02_02820 [Candidatus Cloacimonadota bacterium]
MSKNYSNRFSMIDKQHKNSLISLVILDKMINKNKLYPALLEGDDAHLEDCISFLNTNGIIDIDVESALYTPSEKGQKIYKDFLKRYENYLRIYDIYCAIDLEEGIFAFDKLLDYDEEMFNDYISSDNFDDLRITVCEYQKLDPWEIVFISFLIEKRFREPKNQTEVLGKKSWQYKATYDETFNEILEILNDSLHYEELAFETEDGGVVDGKEVIKDIIEQGSKINRTISIEQSKLDKEQQEDFRESRIEPTQTTTTYYEDYYDPYYYDPYYVSPIWDVALIGLFLL